LGEWKYSSTFIFSEGDLSICHNSNQNHISQIYTMPCHIYIKFFIKFIPNELG